MSNTKQEIKEIFEYIDYTYSKDVPKSFTGQPLTEKNKEWYDYFKSLSSQIDDSAVTKQNLEELLSNLKNWGIVSMLGTESTYYIEKQTLTKL